MNPTGAAPNLIRLDLPPRQRALGSRTSHVAGATLGRQRLGDRVKLMLASDLARRWTLAEIAAEVRGSPVYLTQVFQQVEGLSLYRYQLRLRLARALDLLAHFDDLTNLSQELGFSSHSHFSAAFREAYGRSHPRCLRQTLGLPAFGVIAWQELHRAEAVVFVWSVRFNVVLTIHTFSLVESPSSKIRGRDSRYESCHSTWMRPSSLLHCTTDYATVVFPLPGISNDFEVVRLL